MHLYTTVNALKARLGIGDTADDAVLAVIIEAVSREIDQYTGRWFYPVTQTRYYTATGGRLLVDDLLSVTSLKTDADGDRTYEETWAVTDYDLYPFNARQASPPQPYTEIRLTPDGDYRFSRLARGVEIAGVWGYYDERATSSATLAADVLTTTETAITVSDGTQFSAGQTIRIDSEQMAISSIATNVLTVTRGANGTTAATHTSGAAIQTYSYPVISEAALFQAGLNFHAKDMPEGIGGSGDLGQQIRAVGLHPFAKRLLSQFRVPSIG